MPEVGAGVGGPARYIADATGCSVTAVEILEDLSNMARVLNKRVPPAPRYGFQCGVVMDMRFLAVFRDEGLVW